MDSWHTINIRNHLDPLHLNSPGLGRLKEQLVELMGDRLTLREDVAEVLCAKNIPDDDNNDCGSDDDDVTKVLCSQNIPDKKNGIVLARISFSVMVMSKKFKP